jgi:hypothetical protein
MTLPKPSRRRAGRLDAGTRQNANNAIESGQRIHRTDEGRRRKRKGVAQVAWERGYYYRVRKVNGRVVREYCGNGPLAQLAAAQDEMERSQRRLRRLAERRHREEMEAFDAQVSEVDQLADLLAQAALIAAGYRQHDRGQWRRKRDKTFP